jgi:hypothetical protein
MLRFDVAYSYTAQDRSAEPENPETCISYAEFRRFVFGLSPPKSSCGIYLLQFGQLCVETVNLRCQDRNGILQLADETFSRFEPRRQSGNFPACVARSSILKRGKPLFNFRVVFVAARWVFAHLYFSVFNRRSSAKA